MAISSLTHGAVDAVRNIGDFASDLAEPTIRLGVTGLARSGKTVFITALVHNLMAGARMPFFDAVAHGRVSRAYLEPQPDDQVPRFDYERHMADLTASPPRWPESTRRISQLRLAIEYETQKFWKRQLGRTRLNIDIVDYPGEWLLDLPLLRLDYRGMVADCTRAERRAGPKSGGEGLARGTCRGRSGGARRGDAGRETCRSVHGLSARHPRRRSRAVDAAAWALPHAWRSRGLACAHLRAARRKAEKRVSRAARSSP